MHAGLCLALLLALAPAGPAAADTPLRYGSPIRSYLGCLAALETYLWLCADLAHPGWQARFGGPAWQAADLRAARPDLDHDGAADLVLRLAPKAGCRAEGCRYLFVFHDRAGKGARRGPLITARTAPVPARQPGRLGLRFGANGPFWALETRVKAQAGRAALLGAS